MRGYVTKKTTLIFRGHPNFHAIDFCIETSRITFATKYFFVGNIEARYFGKIDKKHIWQAYDFRKCHFVENLSACFFST